jgi:hypothetical protein
VAFSRPEGGMLHVHENVKDSDENQWVDYLVSTLHSLSAARGKFRFFIVISEQLFVFILLTITGLVL